MKFASDTKASEILPVHRRFGTEKDITVWEGCSSKNNMNNNKKYKIMHLGT